MMKKLLAICFVIALSTSSFATIEVHQFKNAEDETRYRALIEELRCPKCQNQNLAGSDAPIAQDLKQQTYEMIMDGRSDSEIRNYMFERYGDFISYKPPVRPNTWILWVFPPVLLVLLMVGWIYKVKKGRTPITPNETAGLTQSEEEKIAQLLATHNQNKDNS